MDLFRTTRHRPGTPEYVLWATRRREDVGGEERYQGAVRLYQEAEAERERAAAEEELKRKEDRDRLLSSGARDDVPDLPVKKIFEVQSGDKVMHPTHETNVKDRSLGRTRTAGGASGGRKKRRIRRKSKRRKSSRRRKTLHRKRRSKRRSKRR